MYVILFWSYFTTCKAPRSCLDRHYKNTIYYYYYYYYFLLKYIIQIRKCHYLYFSICYIFFLYNLPFCFTKTADDYSLKTNFARTTTFKNTYFNRIMEMWNSIPLDVRLSPSCAVFKSGMKKFLSEKWIFDLIFFSLIVITWLFI